VRELNQATSCDFHSDGPKTLNGLILEHMEVIPDAGTCMLIDDYPVEIMKKQDNAVKIARITPLKVLVDKDNG